ncbi:MAG: hypothetical protein ACLR2G_01045 [Phascolarctobacterium faecium]
MLATCLAAAAGYTADGLIRQCSFELAGNGINAFFAYHFMRGHVIPGTGLGSVLSGIANFFVVSVTGRAQ